MDQPNIILIMTDQQRGDCIGADGHPVLLTPNMDGIAAQGSRFANCYSTCPSCIPARRALLSGQHPSTNGMVGFTGTEWNPQHTLPGELRKAGYQTYLVGRPMHQHPTTKRFGYDHMVMGTAFWDHLPYWREVCHKADVHSGGAGHGISANGWAARPWHLDEKLHDVPWTIDQAEQFLRYHRDQSCPFFLTVSFIAPHPPLVPPAFYLDRYLRQDLPEPSIGDWATPPERFTDVDSNRVNLQGEALRSCMAGYFGLINYVDDQIERLLKPRSNGGYDLGNTVVIFTTDHGEMLGDHYYFRKCEPYEGSARIPLLIKGGRKLGFKEGQVHERVTCLEDLMPTVLDLAGAEIPDDLDGRSLVPMLRGETPSTWRRELHGEHSPCYSQEQANHYLTDGRIKYIWRPLDGTEQLFDLTTDRQELHDLAKDAAHSDLLTQWRGRLIERLKDRPEGFTDGNRLIAGRPYQALLPHA